MSETNSSLTSALTLPSLVDSAYGDLLAVHDSVIATTCTPGPIAVGATKTCTFDGRFCGASHENSITATLEGGGQVITRTSNAVIVDVTATVH